VPADNGDIAVMTVDDQRVFREAARDVIDATAGFRSIGEAASGPEALELLEEREAELVLVDVRMPGMGGIEVVERIKRAHPEVVAVLISIEEASNLPAKASSSSAEALVRKQDFCPDLLRGLWHDHGR
jgi:two-component system invasion response regulator UvrY